MSSEDLDGILLSAYCSLLTYYFGLLDCLEDLDGITADLSQHNLDYGGLLRLVGKQ